MLVLIHGKSLFEARWGASAEGADVNVDTVTRLPSLSIQERCTCPSFSAKKLVAPCAVDGCRENWTRALCSDARVSVVRRLSRGMSSDEPEMAAEGRTVAWATRLGRMSELGRETLPSAGLTVSNALKARNKHTHKHRCT